MGECAEQYPYESWKCLIGEYILYKKIIRGRYVLSVFLNDAYQMRQTSGWYCGDLRSIEADEESMRYAKLFVNKTRDILLTFRNDANVAIHAPMCYQHTNCERDSYLQSNL